MRWIAVAVAASAGVFGHSAANAAPIFAPTTLDFGTVVAGASVVDQSILLTYSPDANHGPLLLTGGLGADGPFSILSGTCPDFLNSDSSCSLDVKLNTAISGDYIGTLDILQTIAEPFSAGDTAISYSTPIVLSAVVGTASAVPEAPALSLLAAGIGLMGLVRSCRRTLKHSASCKT